VGVERQPTEMFREKQHYRYESENALVGAGEDSALCGRFAAVHAHTGAPGLFERDTTHGSAGFFFDFGLALRAPAPIGKGETGFDGFLEVLVSFGVMRVGFAERQGLVMQ
jgi:hypothetical protein